MGEIGGNMEHIEHEEFERKVMNMLLEGPDQRLAILKKQYLSSSIIKREFTGGRGFFTTFNVPKDLVTDSFNGRIDDLQAKIIDNQGNCIEGDYLFFILYIKDGKIDTLECFTTTIYDWDYNYANTIIEYCYDNYRNYDLN